MSAELDPLIARAAERPEWLPNWMRGGWAALTDAGDPAHRIALDRWNRVRDIADQPAYAAIAVLLAEAFDDDRALRSFAETTPRAEAAELLAPLAPVMTPGGGAARLIERLLLWRLTDQAGDGRLRHDLLVALGHLRTDDDGDVYLTMRRAIAGKLAGSEVEQEAERFSDRVLVTAARATPDSPDVLRTVLSYWGEAEPLDTVPTAEPDDDAAPASWHATCALIGGVRRRSDAERLVELAHDTEFWKEGPPRDALAYVAGLERSAAPSADDKLLDVARGGLPASGEAVAALARRRVRLAGATPILLPRIAAVTTALRDAEVLDSAPGPAGSALLVSSLEPGSTRLPEGVVAADSALDLAAKVLGASGLAVTVPLSATDAALPEFARRSLSAIALLAGAKRSPFDIDDHTDIGAGVDATNRESGVRASFTEGTVSAAAFDALVPDARDDLGRELQRIRIDDRSVTYARVEPAAWSTFLDWAAATELPDPAPVPPRRDAPTPADGSGIGGLLGRLFGRD